MNKLTKLGIVTFSAVTLSAVVPTLVHAEENVAPQPNVAVKPNTAQPTPAPKPAENPQPEIKPAEQPQPTQPVKPAENKPVDNKPAETPVPAPKPAENPQPEVKPAEQPQPTKPVEPAEKPSATEKPATPAKPEVKPAEQPQENNRKPVRRWPLRDGSVHEHPVVTYADIVAPLPISDMKETFGGIWTAEKDFVNSKPRITLFLGSGNRWIEENGRELSLEEMRKSPIVMRPIRVKIPELEGRNYEAYTIYTGILDKKTGRVELNKNTNITGQGYMLFRTKKEDNDVEVYQFSKNRQLTPLYHRYQLNERGRSVGEFGLYAEVYQTYVFLFKNHTEKPAEQVKPEVKPSEQPKPAENKPVENKSAETPVPTPKPAENPQPEVKPAEQPQPANSVKPAENAGLPKIPYRNDQPKRWFNNGTGRPTLTTNDLAAPLPAENVEKTSYGWWTAEPDLLHAGSHIKVNTFNSNFNNPMFENGKEIKFKGSGFGDMDSRFKPALVRVKVPELEGMNYEAYTIFYEVPNKNGKPTYGTNRTLQGGGIFLNIKSKEKKEDIQVYTLTKDKKLEELYYPGFPSEETNRYDEKTKTHSYNLLGETYDTYVFFFKNPAEKPAEQVKPEVKPSEQPKPDKQPSVPTVPAEQPQPTKPEKPAEKPIEKPVVPDTPKPVAPAVPDQPQPAKPEKPTEQPVNPVAPITPTTPVTPTLNPAIPNNTRVLSNKAGSVRVHGSEATLKNVSYIKVEETKSTSLESKDYKAFDIHLYDANGKAIQPNGMVLVSLSIDKPVENVYYVAPDGTLQALKFKQDTDKVTFETNHFSIYAMTFKVAASRDNGGTTIPVPVVNSNNTPTTTEQKGNDASSTKTQAEPLATKTETISKQVAKTLPNTGENNSILATLFGMLTLTAGLFSFRKESE